MPAKHSKRESVVPNLKNLYGDRYHIELDEAASVEGESRTDPHLYIIPCKHGHIYPYGRKMLAFYCTGTKIRKRLADSGLPVKCRNWGDLEAIFLFSPDIFDAVAAIAKPKRIKQLNPDHLGKLKKRGTDALRRYRMATVRAVSRPENQRSQPIYTRTPSEKRSPVRKALSHVTVGIAKKRKCS